MKYTVDYFIKKFKAIPDKNWTTGRLKYGDKFCAYGHCGERIGEETDEGDALDKILYGTSRINDGGDYRYQQQTPRSRILAALEDIKNQMKRKK